MAIPGLSEAATFISNLLSSKKGRGFEDGMDYMGNFDVDRFVGGNLDRAKATPGTNLPQVTQGLTRLIGLGPKHMIGIDPINADAKPTGNLDYLGNVLQGLNNNG